MNLPINETSPSEEKPTRIVEGWLNVWEVPKTMEGVMFGEGKMPVPIWEPHLCVLIETNRTLSHFRTEKAAQDCRRFAGSLPMVSGGGDQKPSAIVRRVGGSKEDFDRAYGYKPTESAMEEMLVHSPLATLQACSKYQTMDNRTVNKNGNDGDGEHVNVRRGSCSSLGSADDTSSNNIKHSSTQNRLLSFFSRRSYLLHSNLKRTKSATKLEPKKNAGAVTQGDQTSNTGGEKGGQSPLRRSMSVGRLSRRFLHRPGGATSALPSSGFQKVKGKESKSEKLLLRSQSKLHSSHSHESLLSTSAGLHSISLSAGHEANDDVTLRRLHTSLLNKENCFQLSTHAGTKLYSCRSVDELNKWIRHLSDCIHPALDNSPRRENSLHLFILEAKNLNPKKKYFCEVCLDKVTYGRTSAKLMSDMLFWGEQFEFLNLPSIQTLNVNLYREADKKKKKEKSVLIGTVRVPIESVSSRQVVERWYKVDVSGAGGKGGGKDSVRGSEAVSVRVKARYQTVDILPIHCYTPLVQYILRDYTPLVQALEPSVSVKLKEELATSLVAIFQHYTRAQNFISDTVICEVDRLDNDTLALRGNSIATKAVEAYMKLIGQKYLVDTLGDVVKTLLEPSTDVEVDPMKVTSASALKENQQNLIKFCEVVWYKIVNTHQYFPLELRELFTSIRQRYQSQRSASVCDQLISSCVFLRFFCPAILSPSLFHLTQEFPNEKGVRNVTLVAKTIQGLANFTRFGGKEEFMTFMNDFVSREFPNMQTFLKQISTASTSGKENVYDSHIDVGKHLAIVHSLLKECLQDLNESSREKLGQLCSTLDKVESLSHDCNDDHIPRGLTTPTDAPLNLSGSYRQLIDRSESQPMDTLRSAAAMCVTGTPTSAVPPPISHTRPHDLFREPHTSDVDKSRLTHAVSFDSTNGSTQGFIHGHGQLTGVPLNSVVSPVDPRVSSYTLPYSSRHAAHYHSTDSRLLVKTPDAQAAPVNLAVWSDSSPTGPGSLSASTRASVRGTRQNESSLENDWRKIVDVAASGKPGLVQFNDTYQGAQYNSHPNPYTQSYDTEQYQQRREPPTAGHYSPSPAVRQQAQQKALTFSNPVYKPGMSTSSAFSVNSAGSDKISLGGESNRSGYKSTEDVREGGTVRNQGYMDTDRHRHVDTHTEQHPTYRSEIDRSVANYRKPDSVGMRAGPGEGGRAGHGEGGISHSRTVPDFISYSSTDRGVASTDRGVISTDRGVVSSERGLASLDPHPTSRELTVFTKANPGYLSNSSESLSRLGWEGEGAWGRQKSPLMSRSTPRVDCVGTDESYTGSYQRSPLHLPEPLSKSSDLPTSPHLPHTSYVTSGRRFNPSSPSARRAQRSSDASKSLSGEDAGLLEGSYRDTAASRHRRSDLAFRQTMSLESKHDKHSYHDSAAAADPNKTPRSSTDSNADQQPQLNRQLQQLQQQFQQKQLQRMQDQQLHQVQLRDGMSYESSAAENGNSATSSWARNRHTPDSRPPPPRKRPDRDKNRASMPAEPVLSSHWSTESRGAGSGDFRLAPSGVHNSLPNLEERKGGVEAPSPQVDPPALSTLYELHHQQELGQLYKTTSC